MSDAIEQAHALVEKIRALLPLVTPGEWFYTGYAGVYSADLTLADNDQEWPEGMDAAEEREFYQKHVYIQTESRVATVPASHGDTATGRHAQDAVWIETLNPANVTLLLDAFAGLLVSPAQQDVLAIADDWFTENEDLIVAELVEWRLHAAVRVLREEQNR